MSEEKPEENITEDNPIEKPIKLLRQKDKLKKTLSNKNKVYKIIWRDAFSEMDEWHDPTTIDREDYLCETTGYLIPDNGKSHYYTIASTMTHDGYFCCIINIPKAMVISKQRIQLPN